MALQLKRSVDLSSSRTKKILRCDKYFDEILKDEKTKNLTAAVCVRLMTAVCEERNKALQSDEKQLARFSIGDTLFRRDARQDISLFMSALKRKLGGKFPKDEDFSALHLYMATQKNYFKRMKPIKDVTCADSERAGKTSYTQPGIYNGLP